jgi:HK97 family phage prohead protease
MSMRDDVRRERGVTVKTINTRASALEQTDGTTWFRASTNDVDRHGTIVEPRGIDTTNFRTNPVFMWGHDAYGSGGGPPELANVLGRVVDYRQDANAFDIEVEWADHDRAVMARDLVRAGFLSAVSVGFIPDADSMTTRSIEGAEIPVYNRTELVEVSLVPVPSNPNAIALARSLKLPVFSQASPPDGADFEALRDATRDMLAVESLRRSIR